MSKNIKNAGELAPLPAYSFEYEENLSDIKSTGVVLRHKQSGARVCVVSNEDDNKVFSISFRTPPHDDTGVAHIIEHTVLCGSKKYPVKDPFIELAKGSLNTFLNAMTYPDKTMYPVASCNDTDFRNLMNVYMDAVFYPDIYRHEEIFKQEGWHYELEKESSELKLNGIVYSEMKGAFSSPEQQLFREIQHSLFPDTPYGTESGGNPDAIPKLTYEQFLDFHREYYHPSNSFIYLYGDMDVEETLEFMDREYLSAFSAQPVDSIIPEQDGEKVTEDITQFYSIGSDEEEKDNTYLSYNFVAGTAFDVEENTAMEILSTVLLKAPGAPVKQALIDAGIGNDIICIYENEILQPFFSIIAKNANTEQQTEFIRIIRETMEQLAESGLKEKSLLAAINNLEFRYREGDFGNFPKGLMYGLTMHSSWLYDDKAAFRYMHRNEIFANLKRKMKEGYFENLIRKYILNSTHSTKLVLIPKKGLTAEKEKKLQKELQEYKSTLTKKELEALVENTSALVRYQEEPSTKEALETIPLLRRDEIKKQAAPIYNSEQTAAGIPVLFHDVYTNGIAYLKLLFDLKGIEYEDIPYFGLLTDVLGYIDTDEHKFLDLSDEINIHTGGIGFDYASYLKYQLAGEYRPMMTVSAKLLYSEFSEAFRLIDEILFHSKFDDTKRLNEIIGEVRSRIQMKMNSSGHTVALGRSRSYHTQSGVFSEKISGIDYYRFIDLCYREFEQRKEDIVAGLKRVQKNLFYRGNMMVSLTSDEEGNKQFASEFTMFAEKMPASGTYGGTAKDILYPYNPKNEAFRYAGQVQYAACTGNFIEAGYHLSGALSVLRSIMSYEYLWQNVRVKGGAYGCMCNFGAFDGTGFFVSYRDPNLRETYDVYKKATDYIKNFKADEREMTKYIIGTMSNEDTPMTPMQKGERSLLVYFSGLTKNQIQKTRDEILSATVEDIRETAGIIEAIVAADYRCTLGNENKLSECADLFSEIQPLLLQK